MSPPSPPTRKAPEAIRDATQAAEGVSQKLWFLDLKFEQFATPRLIGFVFVAALVLFAILGVGSAAYALWTLPAIQAVIVTILVVLQLAILAVGLRVFLECCLIVFRIADHLAFLRYLKPNNDIDEA